MQVRKGILHALTIAAFVGQLVHFTYFSVRISKGFAALFIVSILAHFIYYKRAIRVGNKQFETHFFYYEIAVSLLQDCMTFSLPFSLENFDLWIANVPMFVQAVTCTAMQVFADKSESERLPHHNEEMNDNEDRQLEKKVAVYEYSFA